MRRYTVYISGPITGRKDYMEKFKEAEEAIEQAGYAVINPAKVNAQLPEDAEYEDYMRLSLQMLEMADAVYLLNGWRNSLGANRELGYAIARGKDIFQEGGLPQRGEAD